MAIISVKAWYLPEYEPLSAITRRPHDLRLAKNSLLKSALRADFLDEAAEVEASEWFQRYLGGDTIEFYIEGSGTYTIANIDLRSHEIYFLKQESNARLNPSIFFSYQSQRPETSVIIRETLEEIVPELNKKTRFPLSLEFSHRPKEEPIKLKSNLMTKLKRSLIFVADVSPIAITDGEPPQLLLSPHVCLETGYALQAKRPEQIILIQIQSDPLEGLFPFDLPIQQRLIYPDRRSLTKPLTEVLKRLLDRFNMI
ncbi:MAG: hypothetical protein RMK91_07610 [Pseudanabaenaceae cyanobacterium SKYGB_i_bin29]|nr:hypothetical protein [Pseudanabaenaceae cyanobacterium SKYG29]MDW8421719.1 hypothetical protein [Pseudanabaenaceae cyanobacterium SKYGB_i_bin29]